jgi:predicted RNase H-like HicB family nuclease
MMNKYVVELEPIESGGFALTVPALPGLLILGQSASEVLERARAAIQFHLRDGRYGAPDPEIALSQLETANSR